MKSMKTNISTTHCAIENCSTTILNKTPGVSFHPCPTTNEMRNKWLKVLKNKCSILDWAKSKICSKHFESKFFDSQRKLKDNAIPTLFGLSNLRGMKTDGTPNRSRIDKLLNQMTQADLTADVKQSLAKMREPSTLDSFVTEDLKCKLNAPTEAQLWLILKKQEHLNTRLMELVVQTKKHVEILQNNMEESRMAKREQEHNIESLKYIVKCLQEKHATLEEQVEILTAVESR